MRSRKDASYKLLDCDSDSICNDISSAIDSTSQISDFVLGVAEK